MRIVAEAIGWLAIFVISMSIITTLVARLQKPKAAPKAAPNDFKKRLATQNALMHDLIHACGGNKQTAIRLIERERNLEPSLKTLEAIDRAVAKLARDRGGYSKDR